MPKPGAQQSAAPAAQRPAPTPQPAGAQTLTGKPGATVPPAPALPDAGRAMRAVERLYAYWIISTVLLLFVALVPFLFLRSDVRQQRKALLSNDNRLREVNEKLDRLLIQRGASEAIGNGTGDAAPPPGSPAAATTQRAPSRPGNGAGASPAGSSTPRSAAPAAGAGADRRDAPNSGSHRPSAADGSSGSTGLSRRTTTPAARDRRVLDLLARALRGADPSTWALGDPAAAEELISFCSALPADQLPGELWERCAAVARLSNRASAADGLAKRGDARGHAGRLYQEFCARRALDRQDPDEALARLAPLGERDNRPEVQALLATARLSKGDTAGAAAALDQIGADAAFAIGDWFKIFDVCLRLDQLERLQRWVELARPADAREQAALNFYRAVGLITAGQHVLGLGALDALRAAEQPPVAPYQIDVWRGAALVQAGAFEEATRQLDAATSLAPDQPEAYYWRGAMEARRDELDAARLYLRNALTNQPRHVPTLELLGVLELNGRNASGAVELLNRAVALDPRRPPAHLLLALAHAKLGRGKEATPHLAEALRLAPGLQAEAMQSDLLGPLVAQALPQVESPP